MEHSELRLLTDDELSAIAGGARLDESGAQLNSAGTSLTRATATDAVLALRKSGERTQASR